MASVSKQSNGRRVIQFVGPDGRRRSLRLGKVTQRDAEAVRTKIEAILASRLSGQPLDAETARWLGSVSGVLQNRLARVGLGGAAPPVGLESLGVFLEDFVARRVDVKPATKEVWRQVILNLTNHFGRQRRLATITEGDADDFRLFLIEEGLASTTIHKRLQFARMFFRKAVKRKLIQENPFAEVNVAGVISPERQYFITLEQTDRLLAVCDSNWKTLIALCRFGGLRCPSETLSLQWSDIDWDSGRINVPSPKTEHHKGKANRTIPIFKELRPYLIDALINKQPDQRYVIGGGLRDTADTKIGWRNLNMRTHLLRLIKRADLTPWPRLFHAFRATRETELARDYPLHVVTAWLGNTPKIAMKHYLQVTESDMRRATGADQESGAECGAPNAPEAVQKAVQHPAATRGQSLTIDPNHLKGKELSSLPVIALQPSATTISGEGGIRSYLCGVGSALPSC